MERYQFSFCMLVLSVGRVRLLRNRLLGVFRGMVAIGLTQIRFFKSCCIHSLLVWVSEFICQPTSSPRACRECARLHFPSVTRFHPLFPNQ